MHPKLDKLCEEYEHVVANPGDGCGRVFRRAATEAERALKAEGIKWVLDELLDPDARHTSDMLDMVSDEEMTAQQMVEALRETAEEEIAYLLSNSIERGEEW